MYHHNMFPNPVFYFCLLGFQKFQNVETCLKTKCGGKYLFSFATERGGLLVGGAALAFASGLRSRQWLPTASALASALAFAFAVVSL